jgi:CDGSH-type Zn-finger protein
MPRLVRRDAMGPIKIDPKTLDPNKPIWICACGLSRTFPYCDKSHKGCVEAEQPGYLYVYGPDNTIIEKRPEPPAGA